MDPHNAKPGAAVNVRAIQEAAAREFDMSAELQADFGTKETYVAFKKAEATGAVRILGKIGDSRV